MKGRRPDKTLILCLTRSERSRLSDLRTRRAGVQRVLNGLDAQISGILKRAPDHKIIAPNISAATVQSAAQSSLF